MARSCPTVGGLATVSQRHSQPAPDVHEQTCSSAAHICLNGLGGWRGFQPLSESAWRGLSSDQQPPQGCPKMRHAASGSSWAT
eukprot:15478365-Alexandrium_andersonii.AAC.1